MADNEVKSLKYEAACGTHREHRRPHHPAVQTTEKGQRVKEKKREHCAVEEGIFHNIDGVHATISQYWKVGVNEMPALTNPKTKSGDWTEEAATTHTLKHVTKGDLCTPIELVLVLNSDIL